MKKLFIKFGAVLTAACLICAAGALAACGEKEQPGGETVAYTVTVLDPAGEPLKGVNVKWSGVKTAYPTLETGKATANLQSGDYDISLENLSPVYKYTPVKATASDRDKTVTLAWNPEDGKIVYTVKVLDPDGKPVKGVSVELCVLADEGGSCQPFPAVTNAKGEAYSIGVIDEEFKIYLRGMDAGEYEAKIFGYPNGYTYEQDADGYYTGGTATAANPTLTIQLKAAE